MTHNVSDLGDLEREVLHLVWQNGPSTADYVQKALSRPLKESTIRTVLKRLEEKGHLTHTVDARTFIYKAADTRGQPTRSSSDACSGRSTTLNPSERKNACSARSIRRKKFAKCTMPAMSVS